MEDVAYKGLTGFALAILSFLTGHHYKKIDNMRDELPKHYRSKEDCKTLCASFQHSVDKMSEKMEAGFERIYDKLDQKEDKH